MPTIVLMAPFRFAAPTAGLTEDQPIPAANATHNATTANFDSVYASAANGDHIVLANGSYGAKTLNRSFSSSNRLVIRSQNLHGATFGSLTISGSGQIVSGVSVTATAVSGIEWEGSNIRLTRSRVIGGERGLFFGAGMTDALIDHCEIRNSTDGTFFLHTPWNQQRITIARCWIHSPLAGGGNAFSHIFGWNSNNSNREKEWGIVVRLNYVGPMTLGTTNDVLHHKGSGYIYACNRIDAGSNNLMAHRFGIHVRSVGNYFPNGTAVMYDDLGWYYGNRLGSMRLPAGRSAYYDETKNLPLSVGGFHACTRCRVAGNQSDEMILGRDFEANWCTTTDHPTLPDAQPAGGAKPQRTFEGVTYAAMPAGDGITIRAHTGPIEEDTGLTCIDQVQNLSSQPASAAPSSWLTDLLTEYPWVADICPNPTSLTGGPDGSAPWSIAQGLTRGDAGTPNTGPFRDSPGGLP